MSETYQGECLCGAVRYRIDADAPHAIFICHCSRCRKETGSAHAANAFFYQGQLVWERGSEHLRRFELEGTRKARQFCSTCGSPLPRATASGGVVLPVGGLEPGPPLEPTAHIFCASQASWEEKLEGIPRFDELPPRR